MFGNMLDPGPARTHRLPGVRELARGPVLPIVLLTAAYYGTARLGLLEQLVRGQVTPLWPPTGLALTALLVFGTRIWPGIALGAFTVNVTLGPSIAVVVAITAGNTAAPLAAYLLLRRAGFHIELDRLRDALALIFLGALGAMLISSVVGSSALLLSGALAAADYWQTWSVWWTGDAMGVLVVTPFLLVLYQALTRRGWPALSGARWAEAAALAAATLGIGYLVTGAGPTSLLFLVSPLLIWAAFRFRLSGAAPCALVLSTLAIIAATRGTGPFAHHDVLRNMVTLQAFNGVTALTGLLLSAVIAERARTHDEIRRLCSRLQELVDAGDLRRED
ncbi:MASE1 domain-containing protein [Streptomyces sp. NPDC020917]|uniref:MASE1 domain-containing protein n=1 Tax=Streptomyces sp. NPDC020917 TaxID=3365102 RepID=UPI003787AA3E